MIIAHALSILFWLGLLVALAVIIEVVWRRNRVAIAAALRGQRRRG